MGKLLTKKNLTLLVLGQVLVSLVLVEAGFFDQFNKKQKDNKQNENDNKKAPDNKKSESKVEEDAAKLAEELSKMDQNTNKVLKKPLKYNSLLAAAKEVDRFERGENGNNNNNNNDQQQQQQQDTNQATEAPPNPEPQTTPKPTGRDLLKSKILNSKPIDDNSKDVGQQAQQEENKDSPAKVSSGTGAKHTIRPTQNDNKHKTGNEHEHHLPHLHHMKVKDSKLFHSNYWKSEIKDAYHSTKDTLKPIGEKITELPEKMHDATETISATLKLDSKGRLLSMINEVDEDVRFVRAEFSNFSQTWAPILEKTLSYIGRKGLNDLSWNKNDELDFRKDALNAAAFAYEFMRLMMAWRENLMLAHYTYKNYLEQVKIDFEKEKFEIKENFMFQLETVHNYILLKAWMDLDNLSIESKMKLDYLMETNDQLQKNYESEYFRQIIVFQELYEPTSDEFRAERKQIIDALSSAGNISDDQFKDVDEFVDEFKNDLLNKPDEFKDMDWQVPQELQKFMDDLQPELRYNTKVYQKSFLKDLKEAKEKAVEDIYEKLES